MARFLSFKLVALGVHVTHAKLPVWDPEFLQFSDAQHSFPRGNFSTSGFARPFCLDMTSDGSLDCLLGSGDGTVAFFENRGTTDSPIWDLTSLDFFGYDVGQLAAPWCGELFVEDRIDCLVGALDGRVHYFERTGDASTPTYSHSNDDALRSTTDTDDNYYNNYYYSSSYSSSTERTAAAPFCGKFRKQDKYMNCMVGTAEGYVQYFKQTNDLSDVSDECVQDNPIYVQGSKRWFILKESSMFSSNYAYSMPSCGVDLNDDGQLDCFVGNNYGTTTVQLSTGDKSLSYKMVVSSSGSTMDLFDESGVSLPSSSPTHVAAVTAPTGDPTHLPTHMPSAAAVWNAPTPVPTHMPSEAKCVTKSSIAVMPYVGYGYDFVSPWCGDLDGDGDMDCLVGTSGGSVGVYTNQGVSCSLSITSKLGKGTRCDPIAQGGFALTFVRKKKWKSRKSADAKKKHKRGLRLYGKSFDDQTGFEQSSYNSFTGTTENVVVSGSQTVRNVCLLAMFGDSYRTTTMASDGVTAVYPMTPSVNSHAVLARKRSACVHFYGGTSGEDNTPQPTHMPTTEYTPDAGLCTTTTTGTSTCYYSPNYPSNYGNLQSCSFSIPIDGILDVEAFNTESYYDTFVVHGVSYSGTVGPSNVAVSVGDRISWSSDSSIVDTGFKICVVVPDTPPPSYMPTHEPTPYYTPYPTASAAVCDSTEHSALLPNVNNDAKKFTIGNTCDPCQSVRKHSKTRKGKARCWKRVFCYMDAYTSNSSTADMENQVGQCGVAPTVPTRLPTPHPSHRPTTFPTNRPSLRPSTMSPTKPGGIVTTKKKTTSGPTPAWLIALLVVLCVCICCCFVVLLAVWRRSSTSYPSRFASESTDVSRVAQWKRDLEVAWDSRRSNSEGRSSGVLDTKNLMPKYWERDAALFCEEGFAVHSIPDPSDRGAALKAAAGVSGFGSSQAREEWNSLKACLATRGDWLGHGRDLRQAGTYTSLELCKAWRIENGSLWGKYRYAQDQISKEMARVKKDNPGELRGLDNVSLHTHTSSLPGSTRLRRDLNECYLLHGTRPGVVMDLIAGGFNEKFSRVGAFGNGNYFAEDPGKTDQYVIRDPGFKSTAEVSSLHDILYNGEASEHPNEEVFYLLLCRVTMGAHIRTKAGGGVGGLKQLDRPSENVYADSQRPQEMPPIHQVTPRTLYHGLVVESSSTGGTGGWRYREFINFHREYSYPEYILAYKRKS